MHLEISLGQNLELQMGSRVLLVSWQAHQNGSAFLILSIVHFLMCVFPQRVLCLSLNLKLP